MRKLVVAAFLLPCFLLMGTAAFAQDSVDSAPASKTTAASLVNDVSALEISAYGQPSSEPLAVRVGKLEQRMLGSAQSGALRERVDWLQHVAQKPYSTAHQSAVTGDSNGPLRLNPAIQQRIPAPFRTREVTPAPYGSPGPFTSQAPYLGSAFNAAAAREMGTHRDACACHYIHH